MQGGSLELLFCYVDEDLKDLMWERDLKTWVVVWEISMIIFRRRGWLASHQHALAACVRAPFQLRAPIEEDLSGYEIVSIWEVVPFRYQSPVRENLDGGEDSERLVSLSSGGGWLVTNSREPPFGFRRRRSEKISVGIRWLSISDVERLRTFVVRRPAGLPM